MFLKTIKAGRPLIAGVSRLTEGIHYNYSVYGHTMVMSRARPPRQDIRAVNHGEAGFALMVRDNIVFMLAKIGSQPWLAAHYNWWVNPIYLRPNPLADLKSSDTSIVLQACLADTRTGIVAAVRKFNLSSDFGRSLLETVANQVRCGLDPWHHLTVAKELLESSPDQEWILEEAVCVQFCHEGEGDDSQSDGEDGLSRPPRRRCAPVH